LRLKVKRNVPHAKFNGDKMKFIELTEKGGIKILVNIDRIGLIHNKTTTSEDNCNSEIFLAGDGDAVLLVQETYEQIKEIMCYKKTNEDKNECI